MRCVYLLLFLVSFVASAEDNVDSVLASCRAKVVTDEAYLCIDDYRVKIEKEYNNEFSVLMGKIKQNKKYIMNYNDLNKNLLSSKRLWDKWINSECLTEASLNEKDTKYYYSVYHTCLIEKQSERINYYRNFNYM